MDILLRGAIEVVFHGLSGVTGWIVILAMSFGYYRVEPRDPRRPGRPYSRSVHPRMKMTHVTRLLRSLLILSALSLPAAAQNGGAPFKSFDVVDHSTPGSPTFVFSEAYATSSSPVIITVPGRKLSNADRTFRVSLQKHWLSINVPAGLEFQSRGLVECGLKRKNEYPFCDLYVFREPGTNKERQYYIYVGNCP